MKTQPLIWDPAETPAELQTSLACLSRDYPIRPVGRRASTGKQQVTFEQGADGGWSARRRGSSVHIRFDRPHHALRAVGTALAGLIPAGREIGESTPFSSLGIMLDCSRNAVMTVDHFQQWLRQLALLGYNQAMLYTEDTYTLPGEPYFGYLRGRYSETELQQIDAYAAELGIEIIGCIQTLGHLARILHWPAYQPVRDTASVLLADEDATYELIEKMIGAMARAFRSRRLHIGMDETHDLGRGRYMDRYGYQRGYDIFNRHLARVVDCCRQHGLKPMIWSDMYFRMGSTTGDYYDTSCRIPADVKKAIPRDVDLVYWDYYHDAQAFYSDWIKRHRRLGHEPLMGSGVWTWNRFSYDRDITERTVTPCVQACRAAGLKELFFTLWGDDGAFCEFDTAMAGLTFAAEKAYRDGKPDTSRMDRLLGAITGMDYRMITRASDVNKFCQAPRLMWDDPILGVYWKEMRLQKPRFWSQAANQYGKLLKDLAPVRKQTQPADLAYVYAVAAFLYEKIRFRISLEEAYTTRQPASLKKNIKDISRVITAMDRLLAAFRRQWLRRNKPHGMETIQMRLGGQIERYLELAQRLEELAAGKIETIPEFEEMPRP